MAVSTEGVTGRPATAMLGAIWLAALAVVTASLLSGFRIGFGSDVLLLLRANCAHVLLSAGAGAALALSGSIRLRDAGVRPLSELEILAVSAGAASGGFLAVAHLADLPAWPVFGTGAALGAATFVGAVRLLDRPRRWTNMGAGAALVGFIAAAALAGTYARARRDGISSAVTWLLGDVSSASVAGGGVVFVGAIALAALAHGSRSPGTPRRGGSNAIAWLALGLGTGAAGPLAFVGTFAPRAVRALAPSAPSRTRMPAEVAAGAAGVTAISTVPHLLVGGYALSFNVSAGMLAIPVFLLWNRRRLRREVGAAHAALEVVELVLIAAATAVAAGLIALLTSIIGFAT